jgi:S-adenosylmethionine:tRNA ribosyltransferase-isomerase
VKAINDTLLQSGHITIEQWEPYGKDPDISVKDSLNALKSLMERNDVTILHASTSIIIVPGYKFRMIKGIITNFHQPRSTLLLLISAWTGSSWQRIYKYAIENGFRFLSYGDSSLLFSPLYQNSV